MKNILSKSLKIIVPVGLGVYLVFFIYNSLTPSEKQSLFTALKNANYFWVIVSVLFGITSHFFRAYRWKYQLLSLGYTPKVYNNLMAVMAGYVVNMALPRVGEASRAALLTRYEAVPFQKGFGTILAERALDLIMLLIITITTIVLQFAVLEDFTIALLDKGLEVWAGINLIFLLCLLVGLVFIGYFIFRMLRSSNIVEKGLLFVKGLSEGLRTILTMKDKGKYISLSVGIWVLYLAMHWIVFFSLEETSSLGIGAVSASFVMGSFAIALVPGGIGAYPAGIMQSLLLFGVAKETGLALGWIIWSSQTLMLVVFGGLSLLLMPIVNKPKVNVSTNEVIEQNSD